MEFAGALRQAVQASGLTLERIRHRLGRRGLTVSVATLSYWQRGRSRPRSRTVVAALEEILQVPPGALTELLDDPAGVSSNPAAVAQAWMRSARKAG
ncbi:helix-turn-helix domain-containing protein, partial [Actinomadura sp.]|uniref:helix-turn-helix domain-containing protein n=1 Tax=Actinomadura sp. TaxID=1989 RepID=UPI0037C5F374